MAHPRRPDRPCAWCGMPFHPTYAGQETCSRRCRSCRQWHTGKRNRTAFVAAAREGQRRKRVAIVKAKLAGCKTLGDAYRLGVADGYNRGWNAGLRRAARGRQGQPVQERLA